MAYITHQVSAVQYTPPGLLLSVSFHRHGGGWGDYLGQGDLTACLRAMKDNMPAGAGREESLQKSQASL